MGTQGKILVLNVLIYYFWLSFSFILSTGKLKNNKKIFYLLILIILNYFYFSILGLDYNNYKNMFEVVSFINKSNFLYNRIEPFIYYLIFFLKKYYLTYNVYFLSLKGIPLLINVFLINKISKNKIQALFFLFLINFIYAYCDALRQNISSSFLLLGIYFFYKTHFICKNIGIICLLSSIFSHYSSLIVVLISFFKKTIKKINLKEYVLIIFLEIFLSFIIYKMLLILDLNKSNYIFLKKFSLYLTEQKIAILNSKTSIYILYNLQVYYKIFESIFLNALLLKNKNIFKGIKKEILNLGTIGTISSALLIFSNKILVLRFNLSFCYGFYLLIPFLKKRDKLIAIFIVLISNIFIMLYYLNIQGKIFIL